jgi:hypothetical protein
MVSAVAPVIEPPAWLVDQDTVWSPPRASVPVPAQLTNATGVPADAGRAATPASQPAPVGVEVPAAPAMFLPPSAVRSGTYQPSTVPPITPSFVWPPVSPAGAPAQTPAGAILAE